MSEPAAELTERARRIRLVLLDADGVLTDGRIIVTSDGREARSFDVRDGHGIRMAQQAGLTFGIVSGRDSPALAGRAAELGITEVHQSIHDKEERSRQIVRRLGLDLETVCFMGDDLIDLPVMRRAGLAVAPADAVAEVREAAHYVTRSRGGRGAVRELIDWMLRARGDWTRVTARYFTED